MYISTLKASGDGGTRNWLRFSAATSPGNSGGPLLDAEGRVLSTPIQNGYSHTVAESEMGNLDGRSCGKSTRCQEVRNQFVSRSERLQQSEQSYWMTSFSRTISRSKFSSKRLGPISKVLGCLAGWRWRHEFSLTLQEWKIYQERHAPSSRQSPP
jgi:hypothetical protein